MPGKASEPSNCAAAQTHEIEAIQEPEADIFVSPVKE
jgi:hypothetical protein